MTNDNGATGLPADLLLTFTEVAALRGCHYTTVRNERRDGLYPNAVQEATGLKQWRIPVGDLVAAGKLPASLVQAASEHLHAAREAKATRELREQLIRLEEQLVAARAVVVDLQADKAQLQKTVDLLLKKVA